jgi:integrase/recombinase XerD
MLSDAEAPLSAPTAIARERDRYLRYVTLERGRSPHTVAAYRGDLARYLEFLGSRGLITPDQVTPDDLRMFVDSLEGAASTVARKLSSIKNFHRFLLAEGVVVIDPSSQLPSPSKATRLPKALTVDQVGRLLDSVIGDDPHALRDRALLEFLYATGARISEALALSVDDVLGDDGRVSEVIRVTGKGQKQRILPVGSFARAAMDSYLTRSRPALVRGQKKAAPAVFLGLRGGQLSRQNAWLVVQSAAKRAGLEGLVSPHTLRHSFATHVLSGGADIRVVQELLGHASVATTQIYTKVTIDTLREVYQGAHPRAR